MPHGGQSVYNLQRDDRRYSIDHVNTNYDTSTVIFVFFELVFYTVTHHTTLPPHDTLP